MRLQPASKAARYSALSDYQFITACLHWAGVTEYRYYLAPLTLLKNARDQLGYKNACNLGTNITMVNSNPFKGTFVYNHIGI